MKQQTPKTQYELGEKQYESKDYAEAEKWIRMNTGQENENAIANLKKLSGTPSQDESVVINGVRWATCNVDKPGKFASRPEDAGMFYQWNRKKAWAVTDESVINWDDSTPTGITWEKANDPSPSGWRVPTLEEQKKLLDTDKVISELISQNGVTGRKFTDKTTGSSIFLPIAGCRGHVVGTVGYVGKFGYCWSSTQSTQGVSECAYCLFVHNADSFYEPRGSGLSIRPVAE